MSQDGPVSAHGAGVKGATQFGSNLAYGFGRSNCAANCFDNYTSLIIDLGVPTFVSTISFDYMELFENWGSYGKIYLDGVELSAGRDFQGIPSNGHVPDTAPTSGVWSVNRAVTNVELRVADITNLSEIYIDNLIIQ